MKNLKFTTHARERLTERFGIDVKKVRYLFNHSIYIGEDKDAQLHENEGIIFVVYRTLKDYYLLITIYKKGEYDPNLDPRNQA